MKDDLVPHLRTCGGADRKDGGACGLPAVAWFRPVRETAGNVEIWCLARCCLHARLGPCVSRDMVRMNKRELILATVLNS